MEGPHQSAGQDLDLDNELDRLRLMLDPPYEGIIFIDHRGIIKYANQALKYYTGLDDDRLLNTCLADHKLDPGLLETIESGRPDLLSYYPEAKLLVSRQPVFCNGEVAGACGRYVALDTYALRKNLWDHEDFLKIISRIKIKDIMIQTNRMIAEINSYREDFDRAASIMPGVDAIIGDSQDSIKEMVLRIACSPSSVLITGESGVGKELYAQALHYHSNRCKNPFIRVNCAAIPENLLESELFGYVDGAFTGARKGGKLGKFEIADQGTIFLDEIGAMSISMQAKLLRVIQEKEIEKVGDTRTTPVNVRIISATNADLPKLVKTGGFRHDLYYRLNVVNLHIPSLRKRRSDITQIPLHVVDQLNTKLGSGITGIAPAALKLLATYNWPGNVRELINVLETAMNFCQGHYITPNDLPFLMQKREEDLPTLQNAVNKAEKETIISALHANAQNRENTAASLGISRATLFRLMRKHGLMGS